MVLSKEQLGQRIKKAREHKSRDCGKKYTQSMLAKDVGISRSYLGDIEAGRKYPNYALLSRLAETCEVPLNFFNAENYIEVFKRLRENQNISLEELSTKTGVPIKYLEGIENDEDITLSVGEWLAIGEVFNLTPDQTFKIIFSDVLCKSIFRNSGADENIPLSDFILGNNNDFSMFVMLPIYDSLSFLQQEKEYFPMDSRSITNGVFCEHDYFYLRVQGDNMEPTLNNMELALIHRQPTIEFNEIAMIMHNTGNTVLARTVVKDGKIFLYYDNRHYSPQIYNCDECKILGKVIKRVGDIK